MFPTPGTTWRNPQDKTVFRVLHANRRRVLLMGDTGTVEIPLYNWPGPLLPVIDVEEEGEDIVAVLVGGSTGQHFTRLWEQAAEIGVDIEYHWPWRPPTVLPKNVSLVIVLVSHVAHENYFQVKAIAQEAQVPIARVPSSGFRHALQGELTKLGFGDSFGALSRNTERGVYTWTGTAYEWTPLTPLQPVPAPERGEIVGITTGAKILLGGIAAGIGTWWWRRRK